MKYLILLGAIVMMFTFIHAQSNIGIGIVTPDASAILDITSNSKGILIPRMSTVQRQNIAAPAQGLMVYDSTTNQFWYFDGTAWTNDIDKKPKHSIGEHYGGGTIFYVDVTGEHGLISATADQRTGVRWFAGTATNTMAFAKSAGKTNTALIITSQRYGDGSGYAARTCNEYRVTDSNTVYGDWYLPSVSELNLLYLQRTVIGGLANASYWSSSEHDTNDAWFQDFNNGTQGSLEKSFLLHVRAVRAF